MRMATDRQRKTMDGLGIEHDAETSLEEAAMLIRDKRPPTPVEPIKLSPEALVICSEGDSEYRSRQWEV